VNSLHQAIAQAAGGAATLYEQARKAQQQADYQLALELLTIALGAEPKHAKCHRLAAEVLRQMAQRSTNGVEKNVYLVAAQEHQQAAGDSVSSDAEEP
jgi:alkyl sulfatase BDS1-like metallo-beta-lactamase superfamily hydrolase